MTGGGTGGEPGAVGECCCGADGFDDDDDADVVDDGFGAEDEAAECFSACCALYFSIEVFLFRWPCCGSGRSSRRSSSACGGCSCSRAC